MTGIPSLECTNNADKYTKSASIGNGKLQYSVGLLTMDEIWLAGMRTGNTYNYLDNYYAWWSLSPGGFFSNNARVWDVRPDSGLLDTNVQNDFYNGARPALSLKPEYNTFDYGNGTTANPYRFVATIPNGS